MLLPLVNIGGGGISPQPTHTYLYYRGTQNIQWLTRPKSGTTWNYAGSNVNYIIKDCKVYGTVKKSKNVLDTILKYEGNEVKYVEAIAIGNLITQK